MVGGGGDSGEEEKKEEAADTELRRSGTEEQHSNETFDGKEKKTSCATRCNPHAVLHGSGGSQTLEFA